MSKDSKRTNGEGHFSNYGNGKKRLRLMLGYDNRHKPVFATATGRDEKECWKRIKKSIEKNEKKVSKRNVTPNSIDYHKITLTELCTLHLEWKLSKIDKLKPKSADRIEDTINHQIKAYDIGTYQVAAITSEDVEDHIESLLANSDLAISSVKKTYDVINSAYKWAIAKDYLEKNPCVKVSEEIRDRFKKLKERHSTDSDIIVLSDDEEELFRAEANKCKANGDCQYLAGKGSLVLLDTGMRVGELCALRISDFDFESKTLSIAKTRERVRIRDVKNGKNSTKVVEHIVKNCHAREIRVTDEVAAIISLIIRNKKIVNSAEYIIVNTRGNPMEATSFGRAINTIYRNAGLDSSISGAHVLRRTFATNEHNRGVDAIDIAAYIGDTVETVIKHYIAPGKKIRAGNKTKNIIEIPVSQNEKVQKHNLIYRTIR